jgi:isopropylmalate/homocitrate/citramalate synthase
MSGRARLYERGKPRIIRRKRQGRVAAGKEAMIDCEHFFDGYKANPDYALACAKTAYDAGARWVVLCDTNGGTQPPEIRDIVEAVIAAMAFPATNLGIHAHNDTGQAVANSLAAVEAGVRQIQGTLNGIGERCGNANLVTLIPTLALKETYSSASRRRSTPTGCRTSPAVACLRRAAQPLAGPPDALCRRLRLCHQGRHPCLGAAEGPAHL